MWDTCIRNVVNDALDKTYKDCPREHGAQTPKDDGVQTVPSQISENVEAVNVPRQRRRLSGTRTVRDNDRANSIVFKIKSEFQISCVATSVVFILSCQLIFGGLLYLYLKRASGAFVLPGVSAAPVVNPKQLSDQQQPGYCFSPSSVPEWDKTWHPDALVYDVPRKVILPYCSEHNDRSCCDTAKVKSIKSKLLDVSILDQSSTSQDRGISAKCFKWTDKALCAACDGRLAVFDESKRSSVSLCEDFCASWYEACQLSDWSSSSRGLIPCKRSSQVCSPLEDIVESPKEFCESFGFSVTSSDLHPCFDGTTGASLLGPGPPPRSPSPFQTIKILKYVKETLLNWKQSLSNTPPVFVVASILCLFWIGSKMHSPRLAGRLED